MKRLLLLFGILVSAPALAVEPAVISFAAPTTFTDGSSIPAGTVFSFNIYQGARGEAKVKIATISTTGTTITTGLVPGTTYCFAATAVVNGVESAQAVDAPASCKLTPLLVPGTIIVTVK